MRASLDRLGEKLAHRQGGDGAEQAQAAWLSEAILNRNRDELALMAAADKSFEPPPGMPIGDGGEACWFCETVGLRN